MKLAQTPIAIFAVVYVIALLGTLFFLWRAARRGWRFMQLARATSFEAAVRRGRLVAHRQAVRCAMDESYYLSRLALLFCANLFGIGALIFAAIGTMANPPGDVGISSDAWHLVANAFLLLFAAFTVRAFGRTARLARKVLEIRRKMRAVAYRQRARRRAGSH
ncbi:MAG TPA: hypothetical protein VF757_04735 [Sphingomicrobium sp.]